MRRTFCDYNKQFLLENIIGKKLDIIRTPDIFFFRKLGGSRKICIHDWQAVGRPSKNKCT